MPSTIDIVAWRELAHTDMSITIPRNIKSNWISFVSSLKSVQKHKSHSNKFNDKHRHSMHDIFGVGISMSVMSTTNLYIFT